MLRAELLQAIRAQYCLPWDGIHGVSHTDGLLDAEATIQTCWDADRLDLPRVEIAVDPARLCTAAAREPAMRDWARGRALTAAVPAWVHTEWGLGEGSDVRR